PTTRASLTWLGSGQPGHQDGQGTSASVDEPGGLSIGGDYLYIADTNNHAIRVADLYTHEVKSLTLKPQAMPHAQVDHLVSTSTLVTRLEGQTLAPSASQLRLKIVLPADAEFNPGSPLQLLVRTINGALAFDDDIITISEPQPEIEIPFRVLPDFGGTALRLELLYYYCHKTRGICLVRQAIYEMTILLAADGDNTLVVTEQVT
ncbi:MAG: hypothetical protein ONA90_09670, partial [candidate division KSB1 bacterium]|nr:hypothetical protein [candidate division KSB1 bacterium]